MMNTITVLEMRFKKELERLYNVFGLGAIFGLAIIWIWVLKLIATYGVAKCVEPNHVILRLELFLLMPFILSYILYLVIGTIERLWIKKEVKP